MSEDSIHQRHDKFFKGGFADPVNAAAFLRWEIPPALSAQLAWEKLRLEPGSFVDSHFRHTESDLLFSAPLADSECLVYLLFEHQTTADPTLALRLLRYMVRIWETWLKKHPGTRFPVILPIVLAQNAETWALSTQFSSLLDLPANFTEDLRSSIPDFTFRLIQLAELTFEAIRGTPTGIMTLRIMKAERIGQLLHDQVWDEAMLIQLPRDTFEWLLRYMLRADIDKDDFERKVHAITNTELQAATMSLEQQIRQEGFQTGIQTGAIGAKRTSVIKALEVRFDHVPAGLVEAIEIISDPGHLDLLHKRAIQAASLEAFASDL